MRLNTIIEQIMNGLQKGSVYALVALGYTMVYGIVKLINFAHGDFIMVGAYTTIFSIPLLASIGCPLWLSIIVAILICSLLGILTEKVAYKPLRQSSRITSLITAIAISLLLQNLFAKLFTSSARMFTQVFIFDVPTIIIGTVKLHKVSILTCAISIVVMVCLQLFVKKTKMGKAMRAVSENPDAAKLMGISINRVVSFTFAIGAGLAGLAAIIFCSYSMSFDPYVGGSLGIKAFVAAVLGGIGSIPGAMLGGFLIGLSESMTQTFLSSEWVDIIVFSILIFILLFKPSGLMGKMTSEKV
ncbi:MAG: branched-chain amino acid ABC transporter permease [Bacilli bacterium]